MARITSIIFLLLLILNSRICLASVPGQPEEVLAAPPAACAAPSTSNWPGLTLRNGDVTSAAILDEIDGYAKNANTTGGLGGQLVEVTSTADYDSHAGENPVQGSLRWIVERATRANTPIWITFSPVLGRSAVITLKSPLRLGSNVTVDGSCANVTIQGASDTGLLYVIDTHNVVIDRLRLTNNVSDLPGAVLGSTIRLGGNFDAVAILHNEISECGDKCIATTAGRGRPVPRQARVTVAFNYIHDHDKAILFGSYNCLDGDNCTVQEALQNAELRPGLFMTMEGNALIRTAQRNPRVFGRAMLHAFDNYIAFQPYVRPSGKTSAAYGIFVSNGARALIEHNRLVPLDAKKVEAIFTQGMPGTRVGEGDRPGEIRLEGGPQVPPDAIVGQNEPEAVPTPDYAYHAIPLELLPPDQALACVASRAGRNGASSWDDPVCAGPAD